MKKKRVTQNKNEILLNKLFKGLTPELRNEVLDSSVPIRVGRILF